MDVMEKLIELLKQIKYVSVENAANILIDNGVTVQEWISVKDRLPEDSNDGFADAVLVTDGFVQHMAYFVRGGMAFRRKRRN